MIIQCHNCKKELKVKNKKLVDGLFLDYDNFGKKITIAKCNDCYLKNKRLENYQPCEVYSRVCGYLRPVQQWNTGKQKEFSDRKSFKV